MEELKLKELFSSLTRKEKIGQLFQVMGHMLSEDAILTGPLRDMGLEDEDIALAGSVVGLGSKGARTLMETQRVHMERHPKKIPLIFMMDIIHGYRTIYPMPLGMAATFSPELSQECAGMAAREGAAAGVHVAFSPMADITRDPRWGRGMEGSGEDPCLNEAMTASVVKGYQGKDISASDTLAACVKHFAAYGAAEGGRDYNTAELSERTLRDVYLSGYRAAVEAGCRLVMTSFNTVDGIPATANKKLMRRILREEMGFNGTLISDFGAIAEVEAHGAAASSADAARRSLLAGCDIDMMSGSYSRFLSSLIDEGEVDEALLDESVWRVLQLKNELGLFENPCKGADEKREEELCLCTAHKELAKKAAIRSFVLLKNEEGILPLEKGKRLACIGPYTDRRQMMSSWAITGEEQDVVTVREEAQRRYNGSPISFEKGCPILPEGTRMAGFTQMEVLTYDPLDMERDRQAALTLAKNSDRVVLFMGEHFLQSGEAASRTNPMLPDTQEKLLHEIAAVNDNIILVLFTGRPLILTAIEKKVKAILNVWMPGTMGAAAIWDVLFGEAEPGGRLPITFPYALGQIPIYYNSLNTGRPLTDIASEERFQSKYIDCPNTPLYSFGFGLSYSQFTISPITLDKDILKKGESLRAWVTVTNTGQRQAAQIVQLYIRDVAASVARPVKELKAFLRVELQPGESREAAFEITEPMLRFTTEEDRFESETGEFKLFIGDSAQTDNAASFWLQ